MRFSFCENPVDAWWWKQFYGEKKKTFIQNSGVLAGNPSTQTTELGSRKISWNELLKTDRHRPEASKSLLCQKQNKLNADQLEAS